jgi:hypothetical protein
MYIDNIGVGQLVPSKSVTVAPGSLTSAPADIAEYVAVGPVEIVRVAASIVTSPTVTATVITVYRRSGPNVTAGQSVIATLTLPVGTAIGSVVYKDINQARIAAGEVLAFNVTTASTAGTAICGFIAQDDPEYRLNESKMIASA